VRIGNLFPQHAHQQRFRTGLFTIQVPRYYPHDPPVLYLSNDPGWSLTPDLVQLWKGLQAIADPNVGRLSYPTFFLSNWNATCSFTDIIDFIVRTCQRALQQNVPPSSQQFILEQPEQLQCQQHQHQHQQNSYYLQQQQLEQPQQQAAVHQHLVGSGSAAAAVPPEAALLSPPRGGGTGVVWLEQTTMHGGSITSERRTATKTPFWSLKHGNNGQLGQPNGQHLHEDVAEIGRDTGASGVAAGAASCRVYEDGARDNAIIGVGGLRFGHLGSIQANATQETSSAIHPLPVSNADQQFSWRGLQLNASR
jgi:hypothetical protein